MSSIYLSVSMTCYFMGGVAAKSIVRYASNAVRFVEVEKQDAILVLRARKQRRLRRSEIRGITSYALADAELVDMAIEIQ